MVRFSIPACMVSRTLNGVLKSSITGAPVGASGVAGWNGFTHPTGSASRAASGSAPRRSTSRGAVIGPAPRKAGASRPSCPAGSAAPAPAGCAGCVVRPSHARAGGEVGGAGGEREELGRSLLQVGGEGKEEGGAVVRVACRGGGPDEGGGVQPPLGAVRAGVGVVGRA